MQARRRGGPGRRRADRVRGGGHYDRRAGAARGQSVTCLRFLGGARLAARALARRHWWE